jgi:uncharacterized membrane protein YeiH
LDIPSLEQASRFFFYFECGAALLWATSGAMLAARKGYDPIGVLIIALVSAGGGGLIRDGMLLQSGPPALLRSPVYLGLIAAATFAVLMFGGYLKNRRWLLTIVAGVDAVGLGAYAVVGMNLALAVELPIFGVVLVGLVNALGGSVLRDVLMGNQPPELFRPGVLLGVAALAGCILFAGLVELRVGEEFAAVASAFVVFLLRVLALRFDIRTRPLGAFEEHWRPPLDDGR